MSRLSDIHEEVDTAVLLIEEFGEPVNLTFDTSMGELAGADLAPVLDPDGSLNLLTIQPGDVAEELPYQEGISIYVQRSQDGQTMLILGPPGLEL